VTGTVRDGAGRPIAGAQVVANNTLDHNSEALGITDAQGRYSIDTREPIGTWRVSAHMMHAYNGLTYRVDLHPDSTHAFPGVDGATRNFTWRLSGVTPEGGWYGVQAYVYSNVSSFGQVRPQPTEIEVTLTPVGPLVDGSTGQTIVKRLEGIRVDNIPLGRYEVSARFIPADGSPPRPLEIRVLDTRSYTSAVVADWQVDFQSRPRVLHLEVRTH
jgi:hypothetical protein